MCQLSRNCLFINLAAVRHDDVIKWKHFPRYWSFVRVIHRSPVNSPHKGQWRGALMFSLIYVWINGWVHIREAGDLRRYCAHYDVTVMHQQHNVLRCHPGTRMCWFKHYATLESDILACDVKITDATLYFLSQDNYQSSQFHHLIGFEHSMLLSLTNECNVNDV